MMLQVAVFAVMMTEGLAQPADWEMDAEGPVSISSFTAAETSERGISCSDVVRGCGCLVITEDLGRWEYKMGTVPWSQVTRSLAALLMQDCKYRERDIPGLDVSLVLATL